jgi:hypothetical protein
MLLLKSEFGVFSDTFLTLQTKLVAGPMLELSLCTPSNPDPSHILISCWGYKLRPRKLKTNYRRPVLRLTCGTVDAIKEAVRQCARLSSKPMPRRGLFYEVARETEEKMRI